MQSTCQTSISPLYVGVGLPAACTAPTDQAGSTLERSNIDSLAGQLEEPGRRSTCCTVALEPEDRSEVRSNDAEVPEQAIVEELRGGPRVRRPGLSRRRPPRGRRTPTVPPGRGS